MMVTGTSLKISREALRLTRIYPGTLYSTAGTYSNRSKEEEYDSNDFFFLPKEYTHTMRNPGRRDTMKN
jgi:hypothetical protein